MVKIGPKEILYSTTFSMQPGESASVSPPSVPGVRVRFDAVEQEFDYADQLGGMKVQKEDQELAVTVPFLNEGRSHSVELRDYLKSPAGNVAVRVIRASLGIAMLVHVDFIFEPAVNFGPR